MVVLYESFLELCFCVVLVLVVWFVWLQLKRQSLMISLASSAVSSAIVCEGSVAFTGKIAYVLFLLIMRNAGY